MTVLYYWGQPIIYYFGPKRFFFIYLVGGIFSSLFHVGYQNLFDYPKDIPSHGASGSIMVINIK